jgi:hypothetical protein
MIATKRFNRHGLLISALGHVGILAVALFFARAASQEAVPPDAMQVEIITRRMARRRLCGAAARFAVRRL